MKPMGVFLIAPFIIFVSLSLFKGNSLMTRTKLALWIVFWSLPFIGCILLTRFRTGGSFRLLLSSLLNILNSGSLIKNVQNNFSPFFLYSNNPNSWFGRYSLYVFQKELETKRNDLYFYDNVNLANFCNRDNGGKRGTNSIPSSSCSGSIIF